jgi:mono/diheme cytochrome c family protein
VAQQVVAKYCVSCHSPNGAASDYDWSNERSLVAHRRNVAAKLAQGSMPPPGVKQPDSSERRTLWCWAND